MAVTVRVVESVALFPRTSVTRRSTVYCPTAANWTLGRSPEANDTAPPGAVTSHDQGSIPAAATDNDPSSWMLTPDCTEYGPPASATTAPVAEVVNVALYSGSRASPGLDASRATLDTLSVYCVLVTRGGCTTVSTEVEVHANVRVPALGVTLIAACVVVGSIGSLNVIVKFVDTATLGAPSAGMELRTEGGSQSIVNTTESAPFWLVESCAVTVICAAVVFAAGTMNSTTCSTPPVGRSCCEMG